MRANVAQVLGVEPKAGARADRQCRRLVRHESAGLSPNMSACCMRRARSGRPVKWTDERSTSFVSDSHGRDHRVSAELALDAEGHFLAVRLTSFGNMGALSRPCRADAVDLERGQERAERLPHAVDRGLDQMRVHQHLACFGLSRRRPAGRQLLHGAAGRYRRRRDGDRPARIAPPQPHPPARSSGQDGIRHRPTTAAISPPC